MTGKLKVVRTIRADHPEIKKITSARSFEGEVIRVRYYKDIETGETFKTVEIILEQTKNA